MKPTQQHKQQQQQQTGQNFAGQNVNPPQLIGQVPGTNSIMQPAMVGAEAHHQENPEAIWIAEL